MAVGIVSCLDATLATRLLVCLGFEAIVDSLSRGLPVAKKSAHQSGFMATYSVVEALCCRNSPSRPLGGNWGCVGAQPFLLSGADTISGVWDVFKPLQVVYRPVFAANS